MPNGKAKLNTRRNKSIISNHGSEVLLTKLGTRSIFQVGRSGDTPRENKGEGQQIVEAFVEQLGFDCIQLRGWVQVPLNSDLWPKLSDRREEGKGGFE